MASLAVEKDSFKLEQMQRHRNSYKRDYSLLLTMMIMLAFLHWVWPLPYMAKSAAPQKAHKDFAWADVCSVVPCLLALH